jgi:hypothetical protein
MDGDDLGGSTKNKTAPAPSQQMPHILSLMISYIHLSPPPMTGPAGRQHAALLQLPFFFKIDLKK